jgi:hypothetical protein
MFDLYIEPAQMETYHLFSLDKGEEMYQIGYQAARSALAVAQE